MRNEHCYQCTMNFKCEQNIIVEMMQKRLARIGKEATPELKERIRQIEEMFPLTGIKVLDTFPYGDEIPKYINSAKIGPLRGELRDLFQKVVDAFSAIILEKPAAMIGATESGFFIYERL